MLETTTSKKLYSYADAANRALDEALAADSRVLLFGEDIAAPGGVFGVTKGLQKKHGARVFDTPISESAILGGAVGSAMLGMRPIVEIMWADFSLVALDQIINQAANVRYVSEGRLTAPITVRMQQGNAPGACAQHSQNLEAIFAHIPGLIVGMPSTAQDAYAMLTEAISLEDPVIIIENRSLYHGKKVQLEDSSERRPTFGRSIVRRRGTDVTVVTWGAQQFKVLEAGEVLAAEGIEIEVVDMRWLRPYDREGVVESLRRTGRLAVVHEAHSTGGFGAEIVAMSVESGVVLSDPPIRIGTPDARIPAAPHLAEALLPNVDRIASELRALVRP
ncbi:MAG: alpha-ketoacid dehydrogenase subunit beta [Leucobacter sp.]